MEYGTTAHNRTVAASGAKAPSGFGRLGHGYAIPTPPSPTFGRHATLRVALKCRPNVAYNRNIALNDSSGFVSNTLNLYPVRN